MLVRRIGYLVLSIFMVVACSRLPGQTPGEHQIGDEDFSSPDPNGGGYANRGDASEMAGAAAPGTDSSKQSTTQRGIEEADIYKVDGSILYVLNAYRGLQVVDISNLSAPKLIARVPLIGRPVDLYVRNGTAYVAVSDFFWYGWVEDAADGRAVTPSRGSRLWTVDVSTPSNPVVLAKLPIDGDVDETRIVGSVLYVESRRYAWWYYDSSSTRREDLTYVASFDISDPRNILPVDRLDFPSGGWDTHANITVERITLSQSGWQSGGPVTKFRVIDISDSRGDLALGAAFETKGMVRDRWGMDYDGTTGIFRAIVQNSWGNSGASLDIWESPTVASASKVGHLEINIAETLTAARFDDGRAYLVTARCSDPLWVVDTSDPAQPVLKGHLEMPGRLDFVAPRGDRLVAMGHDAATCGGRGTMNVSLFDVSDPTKPTLLARESFGGDYTNVNAQADDYRKVFQVLDALSLILVPFQAWDAGSWSYKGGTQLFDFTRDTLTKRGFVGHAGAISRAFPVRDRLVAMSDRSLQVIDATNRDNPLEVAEIDLARPVATLSIVNGKAIELSGDWYRGDTEIAVTDATDPEATTPLARLKVPAPYARMYQDGDITWLLAHDWNNGRKVWLQAIDVSDPLRPTLRGRLDIDPALAGYGGYWMGSMQDTVLVGHALVMHPYYYNYRCTWSGCTAPRPDMVTVVDLSDPDAPHVASSVQLPSSDWSWGLSVAGPYVWVTHYERIGQTSGNGVRYYVDRIDVSNPSSPVLLPKVNVPGSFFHASVDGQTLYTQEVVWSSNWNTALTKLHELQLTSQGKGRLVASTALSGYSGNVVVNDGHAYVQTTDWSRSPARTMLTTLELRGLGVTSSQRLGAQWAWLVKAAGGKLFLSAGWYNSGVLVYDLSSPESPTYDGFVRTEGYVQDIVVSGNRAYLPSGYYGVPMIDLTPGSILPTWGS